VQLPVGYQQRAFPSGLRSGRDRKGGDRIVLLNDDMEIADSAADENESLAEASDMIPIYIAGIHESW
jgi:hypothetical protein